MKTLVRTQCSISPCDLIPAPWNKRDEITPASVADIMESIKTSGLIHPPVVRRDGQGRYQILAGHRRIAACKALGMETIPCDIVHDTTDAEAHSITVLENLHRANLTPLQESEALADLLAAGMTQADIAAHTGHPTSWVCRRIAITTLTPTWRDLAVKHSLKAATLELVARFPPATQDLVVKNMAEHDAGTYLSRGGDTKLLKQLLSHYVHNLGGAPWGAEACKGCQKRSDANTDLFDVSSTAYCLDPACWDAKERARIEEAKAAAKELYKDIACKPTADLAEFKEEETPTHSVPVFITFGARAGTVVWTRPVVKKDKTTGGGNKGGGPTPDEKRMSEAIARVRALLDGTMGDKAVTTSPLDKLTDAQVIAVAAAFGNEHGSYLKENADPWAAIRTSSVAVLIARRAVWNHVEPILLKRITAPKITGCEPQYDEAMQVAEVLFGFSPDQIDAQAREAKATARAAMKAAKASPAAHSAAPKKGNV